MRKAIITGTFDPITLGHLNLIRRAAALFDEIYVVVFDNSEKKCMFTPEERESMARAACRSLPYVKVDRFGGLLAAYTEAHGIGTVIRGIRSSSDTDYELSLATINRSLGNHPETVFLPAEPALAHISSTYARDMIYYGQELSSALPEEVIALIGEYKKRGLV